MLIQGHKRQIFLLLADSVYELRCPSICVRYGCSFSLNRLTVPIQSWICHVCLYVCKSMRLRNTHFPVLWRPLVKECIPNIGLGSHNFPTKGWGGSVFFSEIECAVLDPNPQTTTSGCRGDLGPKNVIHILARHDTIFK